MNKQRVINFANKVFSGVRQVNENLYRGELRIKSETPAGIYYLDFSEKLSKETFGTYQEDIMAEDYYNNPGHMQWNYYLLLFPDQVDRETKKIIERDHKFARKYVLSEEDFEIFFRPGVTSSTKKTDLINDIKDALNECDLQEVYSDSPVKSAVERFRRNESLKLQEQIKVEHHDDIEQINLIRSVTLDPKFRKFPNIRTTFEFGKVNLITGINGVGKTSLLESIELIVAGRTVRNESTNYPDGCVEAIINNGKYERVEPLNVEKYRLRDRRWYSKSYQRLNETHNSFNTYNFFNSDAAFNISQSMDEREISSALNNLILGPEYNYITERIKDFNEYIRPETNRLQLQLKDYEDRILDLEGKISDIKLTENVNALNSETRLLFERIKPLVRYEDILLEYPRLEIYISRLLNTLDRLKSTAPEINSLGQLNLAQKTFDRIKKEYSIYTKRIQQVSDTVANLQNTLVFYRNCYKYLSHRLFQPLVEYSEHFDVVNQQLNKIKLIESNLRDITFPDESDESLDQLIENNNRSTNILRKEIDKKNQERLTLLRAAGNANNELRMILSDISVYIQNTRDIDSCPVCQTGFSREELLKRLDRPVRENVNEIALEDTESSLISLRKKYDNLQEEMNGLQRLKNLEKLLKYPSDASLQGMLIEIEELLANSTSLEANHLQHERLRQNLEEEKDLSLEEFMFVQKKAASENFKMEIKSLSKVKESLERHEAEMQELMTERQQLDNNIESLLNEFGQRLGTRTEIRRQQVTSIINAQENLLLETTALFDTIRDLVDITPETLLSQLRIDGGVLKDSLAVIRIEMTKSQNLKQHTENLESANQFIARTKPNYERFRKARRTLARLMEDDGTSKLKEFFNQNLTDIVNVFRAIHQPREFKSIEFHDNKLTLITNNGDKRKLSEVSSGQRSAIALAIFITLNRKLKDGPDLILFDDPVSYIDDMNSLSFLDFLRFFILNEGKQIFFATANDKLAKLFQKKFEFLGDDFQAIPLARIE